MTRTTKWDIYLRLSDFRGDPDGYAPREARLRAEVDRIGGTVHQVIIEADPKANGGKVRPASAFKRVPLKDRTGQVVRDPDTGRPVMRVHRPGWQAVIADIKTRRADGVMAEDLDRVARDPRDMLDLLDACEDTGGSARSASGSLNLTAGGTDSERFMAQVMVAQAEKASRDNRRRVTLKRAELAAAGWYGGGPRPFGFRPDPHSTKYHRTLLTVRAEAAEIEKAAGRILDGGWSLKACAADLRKRAVPTVTRTAWTAETLGDVLRKPAVAALVPVRDGEGRLEYRPARWDAILEREVWERLCARLDERGEKYGGTVHSNEPRYLLSGWARCHCGGRVKVNAGTKRGPAYVCTRKAHLRRAAAASDTRVAGFVVARLSMPDAATLLAPPPRPGVDGHALRAERKDLVKVGERQAEMHALGEITDGELRAGSAARQRRLEAIDAALSAATEPDPLAEFRGQDPREVWSALPMPRKRAVAAAVCEVTFLPAGRRGAGFDPESVSVEPAA